MLTAIDTLKGVLRSGTGRRWPLADGRPAAGKTGTQARNTNSWFVGFTPYLTTSVWLGDPDSYTPMVYIPEFAPWGEEVQGGRLPTFLWKSFMDPAHYGRPFEDWEAPPPDARPPARLYLPGEECLVQIVGYTEPEIVVVPGAEPPPEEPEEPEEPGPGDGLMAPEQPQPTEPPPTEPPPETTPPETTTPGTTVPNTVIIPPEPIYAPVPGGTTIPPDVLDPRVPLPSTPLTNRVIKC